MTSPLEQIKARLEKATPIKRSIDSRCPECGYTPFGYRHKLGCNLGDAHKEFENHARTDMEKLLSAHTIMYEALADVIRNSGDIIAKKVCSRAIEEMEKSLE